VAGGKRPGGVKSRERRGHADVAGPALKPDLWKAQLRIPSLEAGPGGDLAAKGNALALHNQEPIVVTMERDVIKVESARLRGRATDLSLSGTINLQQKNPVDLRVNGRFDLATLQDFNRDIYSAGSTEIGVTIRGRWRSRRSTDVSRSRKPLSIWPTFRWASTGPTV
jgi:hypothetical protein